MRIIFGFLLLMSFCYFPMTSNAGWTYCFYQTPHPMSPDSWTAWVRRSSVPGTGGAPATVEFRTKKLEGGMVTYSGWSTLPDGSDILVGISLTGAGVTGVEIRYRLAVTSPGDPEWMIYEIPFC